MAKDSSKPPALGQIAFRLPIEWHARLIGLAEIAGWEFSHLIRTLLEAGEPVVREMIRTERETAPPDDKRPAGKEYVSKTGAPRGWPTASIQTRHLAAYDALATAFNLPRGFDDDASSKALRLPPGEERDLAVMRELAVWPDLASRLHLLAEFAHVIMASADEYNAVASLKQKWVTAEVRKQLERERGTGAGRPVQPRKPARPGRRPKRPPESQDT